MASAPASNACKISAFCVMRPPVSTGRPVCSRTRRSIGGIILTAFGTVIIVASIVGCITIDLIPGDHGDSGDGLAWAGVALLLYVVPFGLMLVVSGLILVYAARSRSR